MTEPDEDPPISLDHVVIHVGDWERSNAFYRDVVGAEIVPRGGGFAYRLGAQRHGAGGAGTSVYFRDPHGSLLEFISYV